MENPNPTPQGGQAPEEQNQEEQNQASAYQELKAKKGFKDDDSVAKSYNEVEQSYGRTQNAFNTARQNIEAQSQGNYTLDDKGAMVPTEQGKQAQQNQQYGNQQNNQQYQQQDPVFDPYTGKEVTDPVALQLARLPLGQREAYLFNAMAEQREQQQSSAYSHETEILSSESAKGFEQDVKKVMMQMPLTQRSDKGNWERALLQVKGARYDTDKSNWGQQANEGLLNKMGNQGLPQGSPGGSKGSSLPAHIEAQYQQYHKAGLLTKYNIKNREEFVKYTNPSGSR